MSQERPMKCAEEKCVNIALDTHFICKEHLEKNLGIDPPKPEKPKIDLIALVNCINAKQPVPYQIVQPLLEMFGRTHNFLALLQQVCNQEMKKEAPHPIIIAIHGELQKFINDEDETESEELEDADEDWDENEPWEFEGEIEGDA